MRVAASAAPDPWLELPSGLGVLEPNNEREYHHRYTQRVAGEAEKS